MCDAHAAGGRVPAESGPDAAAQPSSASPELIADFLRAQLLVALIYSALTWIALALLGQANSSPVALICGVLMLLPFSGTFLAVAPPIALVLLQTPSDQLLARDVSMDEAVQAVLDQAKAAA